MPACTHFLRQQVLLELAAASCASAEFAWPGTASSALEQWTGGVG